MTFDASAAALSLYEAIRSKTTLDDPPGGLPDLDAAYSVQDGLVAHLSRDFGPVAGWKVALTTPVMQAMCGVDHPCEGAVLRDRVLYGPAECDTTNLGRLGVEAEIAFTVARDMRDFGQEYDAESAAEHVSTAHPAIELVDDRNADYAQITAARLIANNSLNAGIVLGPAVLDWRARDLTTLPGAMLIDGEVIAEGTGADILGNPLNAVAWLANSLIRRGRMLRSGDVVMCGSFVRTQFPDVGQTVTCRVEGLGEVSVRVA